MIWNMTNIFVLGTGSGSRAARCETQTNNIEKRRTHCERIWPGILLKYDLWGQDLASSPKMWNKYENNICKYEDQFKLRRHLISACCSYYFHMIFTLWGPEPGHRPQSGGRGPGPARRRVGFGPGTQTPKCERNVKIIWKSYEQSLEIIWKNIWPGI